MSSRNLLRGVVVLALVAWVSRAGQAAQIALEIERRGSEWVLVADRGDRATEIARTERPIVDALLRPVPGRNAVGVTWSERAAGGALLAYSTVSTDGVGFAPPCPTSYDLLLRYARFDPRASAPAVPPLLAARAPSAGEPGTRLHVVQYWTQPLEAYRDSIRAQGGEVLLFLAEHANVVAMDEGAAARVAELPFVRWVGPFHPAYKIDADLGATVAALPADASLRVNLLLMHRGPGAQRVVGEGVRALGGVVDSVPDRTFFLSATVHPADVIELARRDDVQWLDAWGPNGVDMDIAREVHGANYVESAGGYLGDGVRVEVMDIGFDPKHQDMQDFLVHTTAPVADHGTCTSGIVVGSGLGNFAARGAMPHAFLIVGYSDDFAGGTRYNHTAELQDPHLGYQAVLQSNSWGGSLTRSYTSVSQNMDLILFDFPRISICQSQSNAGSRDSRPEAWAKNVIAVGGIYHHDTATATDDEWAHGASIGPAADGRVKPDVASFYDAILCTDRPGTPGYSSGDYYSSFAGTSAATPIVAGHLGLIYQMWADGIFGNPVADTTVFGNRPFNATAKALLINTATQWTFQGTGHDLTRMHQGWGHPDLKTLYDTRDRILVVDETDVLHELESTTYRVLVDPGAPAFKATLVYRDYPGTTSSSQHRINDLDLQVTSPAGRVYWGNHGLDAEMWSTPGGAKNGIDTVENVFVQTPVAGVWWVVVRAAELNEDTHVETPELDADYALVVSGGRRVADVPEQRVAH